jgi:hypothetical protein
MSRYINILISFFFVLFTNIFNLYNQMSIIYAFYINGKVKLHRIIYTRQIYIFVLNYSIFTYCIVIINRNK